MSEVDNWGLNLDRSGGCEPKHLIRTRGSFRTVAILKIASCSVSGAKRCISSEAESRGITKEDPGEQERGGISTKCSNNSAVFCLNLTNY